MPHGKSGPATPKEQVPAVITDHPIRSTDIHSNVHFVCQRLREHGHTALVVGGAVRDLLLGRAPKDFDLATSARPETVKALFRNARIIGRRFRLAQLRYPNMSMEVATFRGEPRDRRPGMIRRDNRYGTSEEDARRRDFTVNALTFDPITLTLYDYVGGLEDLEARRIRTIKPPERSIREDPVRMMRAVRFKVRLGFMIDTECEAAIRKLAPLLKEVTRHRLAEEMQRFLTRGNARDTYREFGRLGLLRPLLGLEPHAWFFAPEALSAPLERLEPYLRTMDAWVAEGREPVAPTVALLGLLLSLGRPEYRAWLRGKGGDSPPVPRQERGGLQEMFASWGMLNGQVLPALAILDAARGLAAERGAVLEAPGRAASIAGIREAVLLLNVLRDVLELTGDWLERGVALLPRLPDLPILDHPRPLQRATRALPAGEGPNPRRMRPRRRRRGRGPATGERHGRHN